MANRQVARAPGVRTGLWVLAAVVVLVAGGCQSSSPSSTAGPPAGSAVTGASPSGGPGTTAGARPRDDELRLNQIQVLGSHNSYHIEPDRDLLDELNRRYPRITEAWEYTHAPLTEQFDHSGVRQIELDVWADPTGDRWCRHHVRPLLGKPLETCTPVPGFKIQHVQELDVNVTCPTFVACLQQVQTWSTSHPGHVPLTVLVEAKDSPAIPDPLNLGFVQPLPIGAPELDALDAEIRSVFDPGRLVTPDVVRGAQPTLEAAVTSGTGWPTLAASRGRVLFLLDNADKRAAYAQGHPSLQGRVMFTNAQPGEPEAAFVERNGSVESHDEIGTLVRQGYLVRTRADGDTKEARSGDTAPRDAALSSGAQFVSTDYEVPDTRFGHGFGVTIPGGAPARCNPVIAPADCRPTDIEDPASLTMR